MVRVFRCLWVPECLPCSLLLGGSCEWVGLAVGWVQKETLCEMETLATEAVGATRSVEGSHPARCEVLSLNLVPSPRHQRPTTTQNHSPKCCRETKQKSRKTNHCCSFFPEIAADDVHQVCLYSTCGSCTKFKLKLTPCSREGSSCRSAPAGSARGPGSRRGWWSRPRYGLACPRPRRER